jgi:tRNA pseudouridine55 synthase
MNGIVIIDKPAGKTSHDVVESVRRLVPGVRVGHAGTLDPNATGVLIVLVGRATKVSRFLMKLEKEYVFTMELGVETDTLDRWGKPVNTGDAGDIQVEDVVNAASHFQGCYDQVAPAVSALKHNGVPLYKLARRGERIPAKSRSVTIKRFQILDFFRPYVTARVVCSSGTYVRSLARDVGRRLGCGASVFCLRRTRIGSFTEKDTTCMARIAAGEVGLNEVLLPLAEALAGVPRVRMRDAAVEGLRLGRQPRPEDLWIADLSFQGDYAVLTDEHGTPVGIARRSDEPGRPLRAERVL